MAKLVAFSMLFVSCILLTLAATTQNNDLVGDWKLTSMTIADANTGEISQPWGENPVGQLTYSANGRMIALLTGDPKDRKIVDPDSEKVTEERADLYLSSSAYSGTWSMVGNTATHKVDVAVDPSWIGTDQIRYVRLDKDVLTIDTAPLISTDGKTKYRVTLVWKRVK